MHCYLKRSLLCKCCFELTCRRGLVGQGLYECSINLNNCSMSRMNVVSVQSRPIVRKGAVAPSIARKAVSLTACGALVLEPVCT